MRNVVPWRGLPPAGDRRGRLGPELALPWPRLALGAVLGWVGAGLAPQLRRTGLVLGALALTLGLLLVAQLQSKPPSDAASAESRREVAASTVHRLELEQAELKKSIAELRARVAAEQQAAVMARASLADVNQELERQKLLAGMLPLRGRGVKVVLDDSATAKIPAGDDPSLYIVHEYQLRDVLNLLWLAGAEAVALNGERIVATTSIYCVGSTILVNDTRLSPPYEFLAIGDPAALEGALADAANLQALKARVKSYGLQLVVTKPPQVLVPPYTGSLTAKHAAVATREQSDPSGGSGGQRDQASEK